MPPRSERSQQLVNFVREEIGKISTGEISRLTPNIDLQKRFGYKSTWFRTLLKKEGLDGERKKIEENKIAEALSPSIEMAWILGVLSGGGNVNLNYGVIGLAGTHDYVLQKFQRIGESLFRINSFDGTRTIREPNNRLYKTRIKQFNSRSIAQGLGDLRRDQWPQTIRESHSWIITNTRYLWNFLEGFFEVRGGIYMYEGERKGRSQRQIILNSISLKACNAIIDYLALLNFQKMTIRTNKNSPEGVDCVVIGNINEIRLFARNIHSVIPDKEEKLESCRNRYSMKGKNVVHSDLELIYEWERLTSLLAHVPKTNEIRALKLQGKTKYSCTVYIKRFGNGSFKSASQNLQGLLQKKRQTNRFEEVKQQEIVSRRLPPVRDRLKITSDEAIEEWKRIKEMLGHIPSQSEINQLKKKGLTKYSTNIYRDRFSVIGSFVDARENLESIILGRRVKIPNFTQKTSNEEVIQEWRRLKIMMGRTPSSNVIEVLKKQERGKFSSSVYKDRFGSGSFVRARENLNRIIKEQEEVKSSQSKPSNGQETQIFP